MYFLEIKPEVDKVFEKLSKKNPRLLKIIDNKVKEIRKNPFYKYKSLKKPLQNFKRVHIDRSFVLVFSVDHNNQVVTLVYFSHHDFAYK